MIITANLMPHSNLHEEISAAQKDSFTWLIKTLNVCHIPGKLSELSLGHLLMIKSDTSPDLRELIVRCVRWGG